MHLPTKRSLSGLLFLTSAGCMAATGADVGDDSRDVSSQTQAIVYGEDDRQELYQVEDSALREVARSSVAALIESKAVHRLASGEVRISPTTLKEIYALCDGERFETQPAAATCSSVLIDDDLVITAGHCVETDEDCKAYNFIFDYAYRSDGQLENISGSDVYSCRRIVSRTFTDTRIDFAIVQLDRAPTGRSPVPVRRGVLHVDEPLTVMGFTSGVPLKVDQGARVRDARGTSYDFFALDSDTFEGSSGSAVLDENDQLAGVLVRGGEDYVETAERCSRVNVVAADSGTPEWRWEQATYAGAAIDALCAEGYPSQHLCSVAPSCGDGVCSPDPIDDNCPQDCAEFCALNACGKGAGSAVPGALAPKAKNEAEGCSVRAPGVARTSAGTALWLLGLSAALCVVRARRSARSIRHRRAKHG